MTNDRPTNYRLIGPSEDGGIDDLLAGKPEKESRQRLQALIAEWLRMENLVVLAGAGCSVSLGGKTMDALESACLATVRALPNLSETLAGFIEERLETLSADSGKPKLNFEDWLSYLANAACIAADKQSPFSGLQWRSGTSPSTADLQKVIDMLGKSIFAECALALPDTGLSSKAATDVPPHLPFLAKLVARDSNLGRAHLFTINYDTLFEQALELLGIQYFDGFTGRADARFDPSVYGLDIYYPGEIAEGRVRRFDKFLHLYKLHGSIHWHVQNDELRARHPDLTAFASYGELSPGDKAKRLAEQNATLPTAGILPTANKFAQTLTMPYAHIFRSFQIRLSAPQTFLLVLGYGFCDQHVTRIVETAMMNPSLVMLVVEPNPKSPTIERVRQYKDLGKRAFILTPTEEAFANKPFTFATFGDFARSIMPDVQWLDDFLRLRKFEKQIQASNTSLGGLAGDDGKS